jgi:hypothetical protein
MRMIRASRDGPSWKLRRDLRPQPSGLRSSERLSCRACAVSSMLPLLAGGLLVADPSFRTFVIRRSTTRGDLASVSARPDMQGHRAGKRSGRPLPFLQQERRDLGDHHGQRVRPRSTAAFGTVASLLPLGPRKIAMEHGRDAGSGQAHRPGNATPRYISRPGRLMAPPVRYASGAEPSECGL